jgi:hypothetical protein
MIIECIEDVIAWAYNTGVELAVADGLDEAFIGLGWRGSEAFICYDEEACIEILMDRDGMDYQEAREFFDFNIVDAYVGTGSPCFVTMASEVVD